MYSGRMNSPLPVVDFCAAGKAKSVSPHYLPINRFARFACLLVLWIWSTSLLAVSSNGVVAVSHPAAAAAGARMLALGGNAIDAAAAVQFALNVVEPQSSGIGGGGFMLVHLAKTGETFIVDSRERAPAAASTPGFDSSSSKNRFFCLRPPQPCGFRSLFLKTSVVARLTI